MVRYLVLLLLSSAVWASGDKDILVGYGPGILSAGEQAGSLVPIDVQAKQKGGTDGTTYMVNINFVALTFAKDSASPAATGHRWYWPRNNIIVSSPIPLINTDPNYMGKDMYGSGIEVSVPVNGTFTIVCGIHYQHGTMPDTFKTLDIQFRTEWEIPWVPPTTIVPPVPGPTGGITFPGFPLMQVVPINKETKTIELQLDWYVGDPLTSGPGRVVEIYFPRGGQRRSQSYWNPPAYAAYSTERVQISGVVSGVYDWEGKLATIKNGSDIWWNPQSRCTIDWNTEPYVWNGGVAYTPGGGGTTPGGGEGDTWADPPEAASDRLKALKDRFLLLPPWGWVRQQGQAMSAGGQVPGARDFNGEIVVPGLTWGVDNMQQLAPVRMGTGFGGWSLTDTGQGAGGDFAGVSDSAGYEGRFRDMLRAGLWAMFLVGLVAVAKGRVHV